MTSSTKFSLITPLCASAYIALPAFVATPALADLTAQDVWAAFEGQLSAYGTMDADLNQSGNTLTASDIVLSTAIEGITSETVLSGELTFRENPDGTVSIGFPDQMIATVNVSGSDAPTTNLTYNFAQQGMQVTASGEPNNISHEFVAPKMSYRLSGLESEGQPLQGGLTLEFTNTAGNWTTSGSATRNILANYTIDGMALIANFTNPAKQEEVNLSATFNDLIATSQNTIPEGFQGMTPQTMFGSGFAVSADLDYGAVAYKADVTAEGQNTKLDGTIEQGSFNVSMDGEQVRYATSATQMNVSGGVAGLPMPPVDVHLDTSRFELMMPLAKTATAKDFKLGIGLQGLTVSDFLWAMLDPGQQLPREPADVVMDLSGTGNWLVDIFDPKELEGPNAKTPGRLESLSLDGLEVSVAGASLKGDGAFTFDNSDTKTFGGIPRPMGAVDLALSGGITLLDKLTAMNLVPQEQAMGIEMMSGLFAKPGPSPDTLTTRIEIDRNGSVLANGQRIQ